ncbi:tripartite tricarboxylate transporter TctB family protein [Phaeovulum sp. W22_SRMD_FR3]|uniref:tripartite tricarboxylate transporter TctB family protein n=1 Tax=Phaeovulum sp. W22_SRMD_FR3 TaxID=3240274 RepID=UPI003F98BA6D
MSNTLSSRWLRPETLTAVGTILVAGAFLRPTLDLRPMSALLPAAMLIALAVLAATLMILDQRKAAKGQAAEPMTKAPRRVLGAFALIVLYTLGVDFVGFYLATAVSVPLVAYAFGFRHPGGLAAATLIVLADIWLIFSFAMSQEFPTGRFWSM